MGIGIYNAYKWWLKRIFRAFCDIKYYGRENLIEDGQLIVACNHVSYFDPLPLGTTFKRPLGFMARKTLFEGKLLSFIIRNVYAFPIDREKGTKEALKAFGKRLKEGRAVVIFPEGTRSNVGKLQDLEPGVGVLSTRSGAPIQPVYIMGTWFCWPRGAKFFRFEPLRIYVAPAIYPKVNIPRSERRAEQQRLTSELDSVLKELEDRAWAEYPHDKIKPRK